MLAMYSISQETNIDHITLSLINTLGSNYLKFKIEKLKITLKKDHIEFLWELSLQKKLNQRATQKKASFIKDVKNKLREELLNDDSLQSNFKDINISL